jgi:hypothetical protein
MIRDRLCIFFGGVFSLVSTSVLTYAGSRLLDVVDTLHQAPAGLANDINLAQLCTAGLMVGACLLLFGIDLARRTRSTTSAGKLGIIAAGLLVLISSAVLFVAFHGAAEELAGLRSVGHLKAGYEELPEDVGRIVHDRRGMVFGGFCTLLCSQIILALSLWPLYWSRAAEGSPAPSQRCTLYVGLASAVSFAGFIVLAAQSGEYALRASPPQGNPGLLEVLQHVEWLLLWTRAAFAALAVSGAVLIAQGARFKAARNARHR